MSGTTTTEDVLTPEQQESFQTGIGFKEEGDKLFSVAMKEGRVEHKDALGKYHKALLYLRGINKQNPMTANSTEDKDSSKPKNQVDEQTGKIYSNMSACYLRMSNYQRAIESADKALSIDKDNFKALYRKGKALGEQGYFEKAEAILEDLIKRNPSEATFISKELDQLRAKDKERERKNAQKLKGFLNKKDIFAEEKASPASDTPPQSAASEEAAASASAQSAHIEEIKDDE